MTIPDIAAARLRLGAIHIAVGILIIIAWQWPLLDLPNLVADSVAFWPIWTLLLAGLIEGIYGIGGVLPGTTYMLFYLLARGCHMPDPVIEVAFIWVGVAVGLIISHRSGRLARRASPGVPRRETALSGAGRFLCGLHPTFAATSVFESGYWGVSFWRAFLPVAVGGLIALSIYVAVLCSVTDLMGGVTDDLGYIFGGIFIIWGLLKIMTRNQPRPVAN